MAVVMQCLKHFPKMDYENGFQNWLKIYKLGVSHNGNCFEGNKKGNKKK